MRQVEAASRTSVKHAGRTCSPFRSVLPTARVLARHFGDTGEAWVSAARLADESGVSQRTVMNHLKLLRRLGVLKPKCGQIPGRKVGAYAALCLDRDKVEEEAVRAVLEHVTCAELAHQTCAELADGSIEREASKEADPSCNVNGARAGGASPADLNITPPRLTSPSPPGPPLPAGPDGPAGESTPRYVDVGHAAVDDTETVDPYDDELARVFDRLAARTASTLTLEQELEVAELFAADPATLLQVLGEEVGFHASLDSVDGVLHEVAWLQRTRLRLGEVAGRHLATVA
jgi:DNA-binding transcriptional ArsR family regulator